VPVPEPVSKGLAPGWARKRREHRESAKGKVFRLVTMMGEEGREICEGFEF